MQMVQLPEGRTPVAQQAQATLTTAAETLTLVRLLAAAWTRWVQQLQLANLRACMQAGSSACLPACMTKLGASRAEAHLRLHQSSILSCTLRAGQQQGFPDQPEEPLERDLGGEGDFMPDDASQGGAGLLLSLFQGASMSWPHAPSELFLILAPEARLVLRQADALFHAGACVSRQRCSVSDS